MTNDEITALADEMIGELSPRLSREERNERFRQARNAALGVAQPRRPYREARTYTKTPLVREIDRRWTDDLQEWPG